MWITSMSCLSHTRPVGTHSGRAALLAVLLAVLLAGCAAAPSDRLPPDWIVGKYHYAGTGTVVKKFPWRANADLVLDRDGQYTLAVTVHFEDEKGGDSDSDESYGSYYVEGNRLFLEEAGDDSDPEEFEIRGTQLVPRFKWPARLALKGFRIAEPVFVKSP